MDERIQRDVLSSSRLLPAVACIIVFTALLATVVYIGSAGYSKPVEGITFVLTTGKCAGLVAAVLLILQFSLSARFKFLDRVFGWVV